MSFDEILDPTAHVYSGFLNDWFQRHAKHCETELSAMVLWELGNNFWHDGCSPHCEQNWGQVYFPSPFLPLLQHNFTILRHLFGKRLSLTDAWKEKRSVHILPCCHEVKWYIRTKSNTCSRKWCLEKSTGSSRISYERIKDFDILWLEIFGVLRNVGRIQPLAGCASFHFSFSWLSLNFTCTSSSIWATIIRYRSTASPSFCLMATRATS